MTVFIVFFHRRLQPSPDELQNLPVNDPIGDAFHQVCVQNAIEMAGWIRSCHLPVSCFQETMNRSYRAPRPAR
ncbi:MAG TPA: hypothetical protein PK201_15310, partial [Accumulibacter sp.]|nr:hypothetical protein [Accumulibacter sp.]